MLASKLGLKMVAVIAATSFATLAGCAAETPSDEGESSESSEDALTQSGGRTLVHYLGSSNFLRTCAGNTLGCGRAVSSVADSTPYFSAPRTWSRSTCNGWYTFRANGKCVEAQRLEVSDRHNFIEANPGLMAGLGVRYSDGRNCAGSGQVTATVSPGRGCGSSSSVGTTTPDPSDDDPGDGGCYSGTLGRSVVEKTCVESRASGIWFQCVGGEWLRGVSGNNGPSGACASRHPL